jgi:copper transport protein
MFARLASLLLAGALLALSHAGAFAHAYLVESRPGDGDLLAQAPNILELAFNEPVSVVAVSHVTPAGDVARLQAAEDKAARIAIPLPAGLSQGSHLVSYRVVSEDGHVVSGGIVFSVGRLSGGSVGPAEEPTIHLTPLAAPLAFARFLLLAGLVFGVGALAFAAGLAPGAVRAPFHASMLALAAFAALTSIGLQGADAHGQGLFALNDRAMWRTGLRLAAGVSALFAFAALCAAFAAWAAVRKAARSVARPLALVAVACAAMSLVWSGHARAFRPDVLAFPVAMLHVAAALIWAGGLLPLALMWRAPDFAGLLARVSRFAPPVYLTLLGTGAWLAATQFFAPRDALETAWGVVLAAKLALVGAVTMFALLNRALFTPAVLAGEPGALQLLRRSIRFEAALALAILAVASAWRLTPPPSALGAPQERAFQIHAHGAQAMASLTIKPARVGPVSVRIEPKAADLSPLTVQEVDVSLTPEGEGLAPLRRKARALAGANAWVIDDLTIPAPGVWRVRIDLIVDDFTRAQLEAAISLRP